MNQSEVVTPRAGRLRVGTHRHRAAKLAGQAIDTFGKLDIVVNNVGGTMPNTLLTTSMKDLKDARSPSTSPPRTH